MCRTPEHRTPSLGPDRRHTPHVAGVSLALAFLLAACGGDATEADDSTTVEQTPVAAATPTPTPTQTGPPERSAPSLPTGAERLEDDRAGRAAFAEHVVEAWAYAIATNDPGPLLALSPRAQPCEGCRPLARELEQRSEEGWFVALDQVFVTDVAAPRRAAPRSPVRVTVTLDIPATYALNDDRTFRSTNPSHDGATFEVEMAWRRGGFVLLAYSLAT